MQIERRKEKRQASYLMVEVFLSQGKEGPAVTPPFKAVLVSFSRQGADVALDEIMHESTHLALTPMSSDDYMLYITIPAGKSEKSFTVAAHPIWFDKRIENEIPPFRIGLKFIELLTQNEYQLINRGIK